MSLIALIIGAGPGVGRNVAQKLKDEGYKVALGSRHPDSDSDRKAGYFPVTLDTLEPQSIQRAFDEVKRGLGIPNVVVYNVGKFTSPPIKGDAFSSPVSQFNADVQVGGLGVYAAIQAANEGFKALPSTLPRVFIATGNVLPFLSPRAGSASLQLEKKTASYLIELATVSYAATGARFYFASQVGSNGSLPPSEEFSGVPHAIAYWNLIQQKEQGRWDIRFLKDGTLYPGY